MKLIHMIVVGVILVVLFALIVPALLARRDAERGVACRNNMRQLGLALVGYEGANGRFPNAATIFDDPAAHQGDPYRSNLYRSIVDPIALGNNPSPLLRNWVVDILPYLNRQDLSDAWNRERSYLSAVPRSSGQLSNATIGSTSLDVLRCPADPTVERGNGNLSYVVNGGFVRWPAIPLSWSGSPIDGQGKAGELLEWTPPGSRWDENQKVGRGLGVMFLGTQTGTQAWDIKTSSRNITDGASNTLLLAENILVGRSAGSPYAAGQPTNWACPLPNFVLFLGSDDVCRSKSSATNCLGGQLRPRFERGENGEGWSRANAAGTFENINYAQSFRIEGSFPFANSAHPKGANFTFCDGSVRFVSETIDGIVYAQIITPAGGRSPLDLRQVMLSGCGSRK